MRVATFASAARRLEWRYMASRVGISAVLLLVTIVSVLSASLDATSAPPPGGDVLPMAKFYTGSVGNLGDFRGTLVCLRCDLKPSPGAMEQCAKEGHRHALSMESESMIHPLLPGNEELLAKINSGELHGKRVVVHGVYYPATGAILVDRVSLEK